MARRYLLLCAALVHIMAFTAGASMAGTPNPASDRYIRQLDDWSALWSYYKQKYIVDGRVVSWDEQGITTSEGQGYAMLRAVWANDRPTFVSVWNWTKQHLQIRQNDKLFAWKWKGKALSDNAATDADTDIALALILASRRFDISDYEREALEILESIWTQELVHRENRSYVTGGNWAIHEQYPTIHVAYLAPYAYQVFAEVDRRHPWRQAIDASYALLHWLYDDEGLSLPPEVVYLDKQNGRFFLENPATKQSSVFGYDAFPIFWRVALDSVWFGRPESALRAKMLAFFQSEWRDGGTFVDRYTPVGRPLSQLEGLPLYATVHTLASLAGPSLARPIAERKLAGLRAQAIAGKDTPYYLHNWLWFAQAVELQQAKHYDEFLGFLRPFDFAGFAAHFPWELSGVTFALFLAARWHWVLRLSFLLCGFVLCVRYLDWRLWHTLNFLETGGPFISLSLWGAELYAFSTVVLLFVQVGLGRARTRTQSRPEAPPGVSPSVDILIPIYSESCDILEKTLIGAAAIDYAPKRLYVLDDGHREDVRAMAERHRARYVKGPKRHAKAGNLNHALTVTDGELIVVFDTDHIPVTTFLKETVPYFTDSTVGFVQTPHHFYNQDIFQRGLGTGSAIPNEQDMFNHAIQGGRNGWGGAFFVGSGAVFRRAAIAQLGGFNLMSITEDIHTSQHLHANGWRSVFVDKDLAAGLTAENLSSYIVQRRRWMLGCLQIFFKDNPLFCRGLPVRHRLGYFASLYYFFFPAARVIFWITPLYFLLFHLHPIFADVSVLLAYLLPFIAVLPMLSSVLLPGWPRLGWSSAYEMPVCFPLFRSMFDLLLPKRLGFKVTPKGLVSDRRRFDWRSSAALLAATGLTAVAIAKGLWEFRFFGIEKDAYFFNLAWATLNLLTLSVGLVMAWERPQRRGEERITKAVPFELRTNGFAYKGTAQEISLSGMSFVTSSDELFPRMFDITLQDRFPFTCRARVVYHERLGRRARCGLAFLDLSEDQRRMLVLNLFADPATWQGAHARRVRSHAGMAARLLAGLGRTLKPLRRRRRLVPRSSRFGFARASVGTEDPLVLVCNRSPQGLGVLCVAREMPGDAPWTITIGGGPTRRFHPIHCRRLIGPVWRVGLVQEPKPDGPACS